MNSNQVYWRCSRRGMLELDVFLTRFFHSKFFKLPLEEQQLFVDFLEEDDPMLFDWLIGVKKAPGKYQDLCSKIRDDV